MSRVESLLQDWKAVLEYLRTRYPMFHQSNVFFRDIQYGLQHMFRSRGIDVGYAEAERLAREFAAGLEKDGVFLPVDGQAWVLNYPPFATPVRKAPEPAKPAAKPSSSR